MLTIRREQMAVFEAEARRHFEDEMVEHSKGFTPELCKVLGDAQLRLALGQAMARAARYGFTKRGPMRLYVELTFLCGSDFDSDPLYAELGRALRETAEQMQRADNMIHAMLEFRTNVHGQDNCHANAALERLLECVRKPTTLTESGFLPEMLALLRWAYPQMAAYAGEERLTELVQLGRASGVENGFLATRAQAMVVTLMLAFGKGCLNDPLYPWIAHTMKDETIKDAASRADRLERRSVIWLEHVVQDNRRATG